MSNKSLNILFVASWYPSTSAPNEGSYVQEQARLLLNGGHKVTVIHPYMLGNFIDNAFKKSIISRIVDEGLDEIRVGVAPLLPGFRVLSYKRCFRVVLKTLESMGISVEAFDIIHSHSALLGGYIGQQLANRHNLPLVHTEHTSGFIFNPEQFSYMELKAVNSMYLQANAILFVSSFAQNRISALFHGLANNSFKVIPNPVASMFYQQPFLPTTIPVKFLMVGDFIPVKNHALLFKVWVKFQQEQNDVQLILVGRGLTHETLANDYTGIDLERITIFEQLSRTEMVEVMRESHVVLSTSEVETFGLSIAEAQALGKPVVVTNSGGIRDIIEEDTGIITELTYDAFLDGLRFMMKHYVAFDPIHIRSKAYRFNQTNVLIQWDNVYTQILNL